MPVSGDGRARFQPIWAEDAARCVVAALAGTRRDRATSWPGPETLTYDEMSDLVSRIAGRPRPLVHVPLPLVRLGIDRDSAPFSARPCLQPGRRPS